jgi:hypothetical protein
MQEKKITYTERGGVVVDENAEVKVNDIMLVNNNFVTFKKETDAESCWSKHKVIATIYPYKIQGIPMIGEPVKRLSAKEFLIKKLNVDLSKDLYLYNQCEYDYFDVIKLMEEYSTQPKALITDAEIERQFELVLNSQIDEFINGICHPIIAKQTIMQSFKASQSLKCNGFSEEQVKSLLVKLILDKEIHTIIPRAEKLAAEYIQSLTKPTSAVFTDGEFSHFNY